MSNHKLASVAILSVTSAFIIWRFAFGAHGLSAFGTYEALAHLWFGGVIGAGVVLASERKWSGVALCAASVVVATAVETVLFIIRH